MWRGRQLAKKFPNTHVETDDSTESHSSLICPQCSNRFMHAVLGVTMPEHPVLAPPATCPKCGAEVPIQLIELRAHPALNIVVNGPEAAEVVAAIIAKAYAEGSSVDETAAALEHASPVLKAFAEWLRKNPWFMALAAPLMASVLTVLLTHLINPSKPPTEVEITRIVERLTDTPAPSSTQMPARSAPGTPSASPTRSP